MKEWFKARNVWGAAFMSLSDTEAGRLAKALWHYTMTGEQPDLSGNERGIFAMFRMSLDQDDEKDSDISTKRAAAGAKGGQQTQAKRANATTPEAKEASRAKADNKNQNQKKNQNQIIDDDDDDDDDIRVREAELDTIMDAIKASTGREASPAEASKIATATHLSGQTTEMACLAIRIAAENGARNLLQYIRSIYAGWQVESITTPDEYEELIAMQDGAKLGLFQGEYGDIKAMAEARSRRQQAHEERRQA